MFRAFRFEMRHFGILKYSRCELGDDNFGNLCFGSNNCLLICSYLLKDGRENLIENSGHHYWLVNLKKKFLFNIIKLKRIDQNLGNVIRFLQIVFIYVSRLKNIRLEILFQKKIEEK